MLKAHSYLAMFETIEPVTIVEIDTLNSTRILFGRKGKSLE
jgi:hypothetical protein